MKKTDCLLLSIYTCFTIFSCAREATCEEAAENVRTDNCNIIVKEIGSPLYQFSIKGLDPETNAIVKFEKINHSWSFQFSDKISLGDTVVKKKGELKFYIHKKDTVLVFPFECKGKIYE
jgi:hypothetical protein